MEYWIDYSLTPGHKLEGMRMPEKYVVEMFCDRLSACKTYQKEKYTDASALAYFERGMGHYTLHPESEKLIRSLLTMVKEEGEEKTFDYIRREVLHNKK